MIRILLVDDQQCVRQGLMMRLALEADLQVVGEASDGAQALELIPLLHPDVVLMDVEMPGMDGIAATVALREQALQSAVVMLSLHDDDALRARALSAGAVAFAPKHISCNRVIEIIRTVAVCPPDSFYGKSLGRM